MFISSPQVSDLLVIVSRLAVMKSHSITHKVTYIELIISKRSVFSVEFYAKPDKNLTAKTGTSSCVCNQITYSNFLCLRY